MPTSKAKMKTLTDVPWQRKGCRHSKEFRRDRQSYMDIGKESQIKCLWLGAGVFVLPVMSLCVWGFGAWPIPFFFSGCSFFTGAFCTTRDYLCNFTWTSVTLASRGGKCLIRRNFPVTENLDLIWTAWHTLKNTKFQVARLGTGKCLYVYVQAVALSNSLTAATCMQSLGSAERLQVLPPCRPGCWKYSTPCRQDICTA